MSEFQRLIDIVKQLRDPLSGCPWDRVQTHQTLKKHLIEESYEVIDAIDANGNLKEELGDLLLQVMLHSQIAADSQSFSIDDVVKGLTDKLVERHPHVFGSTKATNVEEALASWNSAKEKKNTEEKRRTLQGVPRSLPALQRAQKVSEKAAGVGFEWPNIAGVRDQVLEEVQEFVDECTRPGQSLERIKGEFGDILFSLVQVARRMGFSAEESLTATINKFERRFDAMENAMNKPLKESTLEEMDRVWKQVKIREQA